MKNGKIWCECQQQALDPTLCGGCDHDAPQCDHVDYEVDILTGRATCACGHSWYQTAEQVKAEREHQRAWDAHCAKIDAEQPTAVPADRFLADDDLPF